MFLCRCRRSKVGGMGFLKLISQAFPRPLPSLPSFFPALSLAFFFARTPLSERLEQANPESTGFLVSGRSRESDRYFENIAFASL